MHVYIHTVTIIYLTSTFPFPNIVAICGPPPILTGMEYLHSITENSTWYTGDELQLVCKQGYELLDKGGVYQGLQGTCTCSKSTWNYNSFCQGTYVRKLYSFYLTMSLSRTLLLAVY